MNCRGVVTRCHKPANGQPMKHAHPVMPIAATFLAIALLSWMDAFMKGAAIAIGAYSALLVRALIGVVTMGPVWRIAGGRWPGRAAFKLHVVRGVVIAGMAFTFFFALVRLPIAQAIAISFISPLVALFLAALLLGEKIRLAAIVAGLLGLAGVIVILLGKISQETMGEEATIGVAAVLLSALLYAWNLILTRQQAKVAGPVEVAAFQNGVVLLVLGLVAPFFFTMPDLEVLLLIAVSSALSTAGTMLLSWSYGQEEAQVLVPIEYSGFLWGVLFGWLYFAEQVTASTVAGAVMIVVGCLVATRRRPEQSSL